MGRVPGKAARYVRVGSDDPRVDTAEVAQIVAAVATSIAAVAAAASAVLSRSAVERGNLAFVWPEFGVDEGYDDNEFPYVWVRLRSDGPGIALDVRWSIFVVPEPGCSAWQRAEEEAAASAKRAVRALRPGQGFPAERDRPQTAAMPARLRDEPWSVVVRWSDSAGRRWEFVESTGGLELAHRPRRVRRARW